MSNSETRIVALRVAREMHGQSPESALLACRNCVFFEETTDATPDGGGETGLCRRFPTRLPLVVDKGSWCGEFVTFNGRGPGGETNLAGRTNGQRDATRR